MEVTLGRVICDLTAGRVVTVEGERDQLARVAAAVIAWARAEGHHSVDVWTRPGALRLRLGSPSVGPPSSAATWDEGRP